MKNSSSKVWQGYFKKKMDEYPASEWDDAGVWEAIQQKQKRQRVVTPIWLRYAASIMIVAVLGWLFFLEKDAQEQVTKKEEFKEKVAAEPNDFKSADTSTGNDAGDSIVKTNSKLKVEEKVLQVHPGKGIRTEGALTKIKLTSIPKLEEIAFSFDESLIEHLPKETYSQINQIIENEGLENDLNPVISNQTIILNIPLDEIESSRKRKWVGRFLTQVGESIKGNGFAWEEVNVRPKEFLVYLKRSFSDTPDHRSGQDQ